MNRFVLFCVVLLIAMPALSASANDGARFRGTDGAGVAVGQTIPSVVGPDKNVLWKVAIPKGTSSPIIIREKLLLTSHKDEMRTLHCLNALTGAIVWERSVKKGHDEIATAPAGPSTPTPVSDGKSVFVFDQPVRYR